MILVATFFVGIFFIVLFSDYQKKSIDKASSENLVKATENKESPVNYETIDSFNESSEAKAIRVAEEFIAENGYTDLPANRSKLSHETVEFYKNIDELLQERANTLERKAYGVLYGGSGTKIGKKGWTIAFRYKNLSDDYYKSLSREFGKKITKESHPLGRTVTMDENFQNLLVEHKDFPLLNVDKKL